MTTIFHGDNFVASRQALNHLLDSLKSTTPNLTLNRFEAKKTQVEDLAQALESASLFGHDQLVIIENLLSLPRSSQKSTLINILLKNLDKHLIIWEKKSLSPSLKKQFSSATLKEFKLPSIIFKFLDSLKPGQVKTSLQLLHQCYQKDAPELVFYMLCRRVSQLIQAKDSQSLKLAPWQKAKLKSQVQNFTLKKLLSLHRQLLDLDYHLKTGQTDLSVSTQLDLLLATL